MNYDYMKVLNKLKFTIIDIEKEIYCDSRKSYEDMQICTMLENLLEDMKFATYRIEYYSKTPISGLINELPNGHFEIHGHELMCGSSLEIFSEKYSDWFLGRVEYDDKYFFYSDDLGNPTLYTGMQARIRI